MSSFMTQQNLILCVGVLLLLAPVLKTLIVSYLRPGAPGVGDFQKRVVWDLLTLNDKLQAKGHDKASEICKDLIINLVTGQNEDPKASISQKVVQAAKRA